MHGLGKGLTAGGKHRGISPARGKSCQHQSCPEARQYKPQQRLRWHSASGHQARPFGPPAGGRHRPRERALRLADGQHRLRAHADRAAIGGVRGPSGCCCGGGGGGSRGACGGGARRCGRRGGAGGGARSLSSYMWLRLRGLLVLWLFDQYTAKYRNCGCLLMARQIPVLILLVGADPVHVHSCVQARMHDGKPWPYWDACVMVNRATLCHERA